MEEASQACVIERRPAAGGKPSVTYRYAGDRYLLAEYGEMNFDLTLNFIVQAVDGALQRTPFEGLIEAAPGFRSILVSYEPRSCRLAGLIEHLDRIYDGIPDEKSLVIPSRRIYLPIAFDDSQTREAVTRYAQLIRADAPNVEGGTNVDYTVRYNGFSDREELYAAVLGAELWTAFIGFFPGLPFMFPLDPLRFIFVPKYNPTRTWTPEGAVGIGGPCYSIYPVESPGGYQLIGRTLPIYDLRQRNSAFKSDPILVRPADRIVFHRVSEQELLDGFADVHADRYQYRIEDAPFDVSAYLAYLERIRPEAEAWRHAREEAAQRTPVA
ncbi:carboxyltransferase domain-containing protein [bacterium]|nr:MAG: carboxyltransferase domain-containing protein [bacterium]